jgi:hypothetical protein
VRIHLDFGLKETTGYDTTYGTSTYHFSATDGDSFNPSVEIQNQNIFKHDPGIAGMVTETSTGDPVGGVAVKIYDPANNLLATVTTDEDGFYFYSSTSTTISTRERPPHTP